MERQAMLEIIEEQIQLISESSSRCATVGNWPGLISLTDALIKLLGLIADSTLKREEDHHAKDEG